MRTGSASTGKKVVVIGAGVGGLAAAIRLAVAGFRVSLLEANDSAGGKLAEFRQDGFRFDMGPSLFTLPHLVTELFELCNADPVRFVYRKVDIACRYFWPDRAELTAWSDPERCAAEIERVLSVPAPRVLEYFESCRRKYDLTAPTFLGKSLHRVSSYIGREMLDLLLNASALHLTTSMHAVNARYFDHPKLIQMFDRFATYNGSDPYRAPGVLTLIPHLEHTMGTYIPDGGMYTIARKLQDLAMNAGVEIFLNTPAKRICVDRGAVTGVQADDGIHDADIVVSGLDIWPTYHKLLPDFPPPGRYLNRERSTSAMIFYWGISASFPRLSIHNVFFSEDYAGEFRCLFRTRTIHPDPTIYVAVSCRYSPGDAPPGCENWFVMINAPVNTGQDWDSMIRDARATTIAKLSRILDADIASLIVTERVLDPRDIESRTASYGGSLYGSSSNSPLAAFLRHPNFNAAIRNLYFVGGSVHPGGGIPLCLLSAKIVTDLITGR